MSALRSLLATWFGSGLAPVAPGTFGTLATLPLVVLLWRWAPGWPHLLVGVLVFFAGTWASHDAESRFGRKDPGCVVVDESAGMLVASAWLPPSALNLVLAFALFRAADILKPWPCRSLEGLPRGWGIMADDVAAGLWAQAAFWTLRFAWETLA